MDYSIFVSSLIGLNVFVVPVAVVYLGFLLDKRNPSQSAWVGCILGICALAGCMALSPTLWLRIAPVLPSAGDDPIANGDAIFGTWAGGAVTFLSGVCSGAIGHERVRDRATPEGVSRL